MDKLADLHTHSCASDGALTPTQVVEAASLAGLAAVAVTDHDTVEGIDEAIAAGERFGVEIVPGVEISTMHGEKTELHILGYYFDHHDQGLLNSLAILKNARWERARKMVELLNQVGIAVDFDRVIEIASGGAIGRPHIARALCEIGAVWSMDSAFGRYLQEGGAAFVPRYKVEPAEAIRMIRSAGGVACCAHPGKLKRDNLLMELIGSGLQGVEVYHPDHPSSARKYYRRFAQKHGLVATGGSDAHCFHPELHPGIGGVTVPYEVVEDLKRIATG